MAQPPARSQCQLLEEMKRTPVSDLSTACRTQLGMVMDAPREVQNRDYRYFAEKLGMTPNEWQWTDTQKCPTGTRSSTCLVLEFLISRHGNGFTVFHIYRALEELNLDGRQHLIDFMHDYLSTRPGEEHREDSICGCGECHDMPFPRPPPSADSLNSYPPPYPGSQRSHVDANDGSGYPQVPLQGRRPGENGHWSPSQFSDHTQQKQLYGQELRENLHLQNPVADENSFHQSCNDSRLTYHSHPTSGGGRFSQVEGGSYADFSGFQQNQSEGDFLPEGPATLIRQLERDQVGCQTGSENKVRNDIGGNQLDWKEFNPLSDPALNVSPRNCFSSESCDSRLPAHFVPNIPPGDHHSMVALSERFESRPSPSSARSSTALSTRPASFPRQTQPLEGRAALPNRPVSDSMMCCHEGACNCPINIRNFPHTSQFPEVNERVRSNPSQNGYIRQPAMVWYLGPDSFQWSPGHHELSISTADPLNDDHHTPVKEVVPPFPPSPGQSPQMVGPTPKWHPQIWKEERQPPSVPGQFRRKSSSHNSGLSRQFVLIVAGDQENGDTLKDQVTGLGRLLEEHGVPYVIVMSSVEQPVIRLTRRQRERLPPITGDTGSLKRFVEKCYEKAKKILIAVSPGYLLYADAYVDGAQVSKTPQQQIIRDHHEKMKQEHNKSSSSTHRLWPVLLHEMNANRTHIPNFLQKVYFYWYGRNNEENVGVVLGEEFQNAPRMNE